MDENMLCTKTDEYLIELDNGVYEVGITDYAVEQLGDIIFVELPDIGTSFSKNETFSTIESVKTAREVYMPISGTVVEINEEIANNPEFFNSEDCDSKWMLKIESDADLVEFADLIDYSDYIEEIK